MIYIRVDMNPVIATGHLMRCLSIAEAAQRAGEEACFITADEYPCEMVSAAGYEQIVLGTDWRDMNSELEAMKAIIAQRNIKVLLIDSYQVTEKYFEVLNKITAVYYIDDLNECRFHVTGLINYACYAEDMKYEALDANYYLGCRYAPLREMFIDCPQRVITGIPQKLLVLSGGTDPSNMLLRILKMLKENAPQRYDMITIICGRYYTEMNALLAEAASGGEEFEKHIRILPTVANMRDYFDDADVVISAGGTTMYEVCAVGVPTISFSIADNQFSNVRWLDEHGVVPYAGDARFDNVEENILRILKKFDDVTELAVHSERMQRLVDGHGSERMAQLLIGLHNSDNE